MDDESATTNRSCPACGHVNLSEARFCVRCGRQLGQDAPMTPASVAAAGPRVFCSEGVSPRTLQRLRTVSTRLQARGGAVFATTVTWPIDDTGPLVQELPESTLPLAEALSHASGYPWGWKVELLERMARAIDTIADEGARLNSLNLECVLVERQTGRFAGFCLPLSLTDREAGQRADEGIDCRFAAPEVQGFVDAEPDRRADVFALGMISLYLLADIQPRDLVACEFEPLAGAAGVGPAVRQVLGEALSLHPAGRPATAAALAEQLRQTLVDDAAQGGFEFQYSMHSDVGLGGREQNEDTCCAWTQLARGTLGHAGGALFAVADGMGGSALGERASAWAIKALLQEVGAGLPTVGRCFTDPARLPEACRDWVLTLNAGVSELGQRLGEADNVGTTLTAVLCWGRRAVLLHVGDSRAYRWRAGVLVQLSCDQTLAEQRRQSGQENEQDPQAERDRHTLVSHLGTDYCEPQIVELELQPGDVYLLCSDGLTEGIPEWELAEVLVDIAPQSAAQVLVDRAKWNLAEAQIRGGMRELASDNLTAVVFRVSAVRQSTTPQVG